MAVRKAFDNRSICIKALRLVPMLLLAMQVGLCIAQDTATAGPEPNAVDASSGLAINFQDVPLQTVLEYLSEKAGLVVVTEMPLSGRVTVISRTPITVDAIISLINSTLKDKGMAAVRAGNTLRVVSLTKARTMNLPVTAGSDPDEIVASDDIVTHVIPIRYADVAKLRTNLQPLLPEYATMEANEDGNALIVTDTTANIKRFMEIIRALDTHMAMVAEIKVFHLNLADATTTAELINKIFEQESPQTSSRTQARGPEAFFQMMGPGGQGGRGGRRGDDGDSSSSGARANSSVVASADQRTNSVVVRGPADMLGVVGDVVTALDSRSASVADVKVFHLEYADAQSAAQLVNEVFGSQRTSSTRSRTSGTSNMPVTFRGGPFGQAAGATETSQASSTIEVVAASDARTNSVVVSGPANTLVVVAQIIKELDANPDQERQVFIYPLKNAEAANLKEILNNLFSEMQSLNQAGGSTTQRFQGQTGPGGATAQGTSSSDLSEEAYFEADTHTNVILVMTSSKNYKMIEPIIEKLDKRLGQVLIKVLFAEVTYGDSLDLGFEFSFLNMRKDGDFQDVGTGFGLGSQSGGLIVKALTGDINMTLRALQQKGKLNILSRPYILTSDNQTARILVGEEVPFITNTRETNEGQTINTIQYQDIGIILEVTPSINPEGLVIMNVVPEISTTTAKTVPISETVNAAVYAKRSAETRVAVRDGQTIVIGGLVKDEIKESIDKVPLLGDLPILGGLFRRTIQDKGKTELLIFLTPHVAMSDDDLQAISSAHGRSDNIEKDEDTSEMFRKHMESMLQADLEKVKPAIKP
ncbi:MAG: hypothetical protein IH624_06900 [Phycisphaerae bacterium]|nr:hypothetical protein [Phycisphaerae bacterium]